MNKELPKIDLPEEWLIGTGINKDLLNLYTNFPCRLKSEIFVLCMDGEIEASVNLNNSDQYPQERKNNTPRRVAVLLLPQMALSSLISML